MSAKNEWTPYGLEAIRIAHLRRRRLAALLLLAGLGSLLMWGAQTTVTTQMDISVNGRNGGNGISFDVPDEKPEDDGPITVSVSPGKITRAETGAPAPQSTVSRTAAPTFTRAPAYNIMGVLLALAPWLLVGGAAYLLGKRRGKHDEVNYGVYKGALPLEMITAGASRQVFTRKHARASLFGKRRADHVPAERAAEEP